jgi:tripartite-type tricarboxylate transporter receptor subunit TctC
MLRRAAIAFFLVGIFFSQSAFAQYPMRPVHVVVPYPAGGAVDAFARVLAQRLSGLWNQQVIVDNRPGASTMIGAEQVAKSPPDGYTLLLTAELTLVTVPHLHEKIPYDPIKDFAPITGLVSATQALVANPSLPVKTTKDLVALAKTKPGQLTYGSFGIGSTGHLNMEMLQSMTGARFNHIPYNGAGPAMNDVIGGHIDFMLAALSIVQGNVRAGKLRMIGVGSDHRSSQFPDVPTISESGAPGFEAKSWFGLVAPAGTPTDVIEKINHDVGKTLSDPSFAKDFLAAQGLESILSTPEQFAAFIRSETLKWGKVVKDANIKVTK